MMSIVNNQLVSLMHDGACMFSHYTRSGSDSAEPTLLFQHTMYVMLHVLIQFRYQRVPTLIPKLYSYTLGISVYLKYTLTLGTRLIPTLTDDTTVTHCIGTGIGTVTSVMHPPT